MEPVLHGVQDLMVKCRSLFRWHGSLIIVAGVASLIALKALKRMKRTRVDLHALFGGPNHLLPVLGFIPKSVDHLYYASEIYADTYGGVYHMRFVGGDMIVVSDPELIRQVLNARPKTYIKPFNKHKIVPVDGMFTTEGEVWRRNRRLGAPAFNDINSSAMIPDMSKVALRLIQQLKSLSQDGVIVWCPTGWLPLCTLDILCVTTLGKDYNFVNPDGVSLGQQSGELQLAMEELLLGSGYAAQRSAIAWTTRDRFPWNLNPMIRQMHSGAKQLRRICDEIIAKRRAERDAGERGERRDLLDKLLHLDEADLRGNLMTFLIAGSDTTATTVAWCLCYLALYPGIQDKARAEVDGLGHDPDTIEDLEELVYIKCCILEALRLEPPAVLLLHECTHDTELNGHQIPSGTNVMTLLRKVMITESQGGKTFNPERWLLPGGSSIDQARVRDHLAFGGGPRQCPGQNMAIKEAVVILTLILRHFHSMTLACPTATVRGEARLSYKPQSLELKMRQRLS
ncbi:cytochrome P450, putative [Perkinsus marinus ATCC 50983]|uniref:Cytochrome P450, putative n=1 Tax=Perkinsus marinus (strain ATCC 50983 / TXsc) TaxID=423536 RepID=C5L2F2_PERM5|nr:cytochrome P450, putative [Perkinsus marinus ATCC 50983]EER09046.1 cytochrome P450, putative [Perkinsus marinus ATCC 50983]|eukprot:XP_002777230.1 cytochrome P450, putative [Perkinsus marinus ATCC 50983]